MHEVAKLTEAQKRYLAQAPDGPPGCRPIVATMTAMFRKLAKRGLLIAERDEGYSTERFWKSPAGSIALEKTGGSHD